MVQAAISAGSKFTDFVLRRGDNDKSKRCGGVAKPTMSGTPVKDLQQALVAVGVLTGMPDGDYGRLTEIAVRRFQWNVRTLKYRIQAGTLRFTAPNLMISVNGTADAATAQELARWISVPATTTGNLVCADVTLYDQFINEVKLIAHPNVAQDDMVVDADFVASLAALNQAAKASKVKLYITQAFRVSGAPVGGAVVTPAKSSQHLIGHAIDCNILDGKVRISSESFKNGVQTDAADKFVDAAKEAGLRWGGDFQTVDYVHFDDNVAPHSDDYVMRYYFNQRVISEQQPIPDAAA